MIYKFTLVMSSVVQTSLKRFLHWLRSVVIGLPLEHWRKKCQLVQTCISFPFLLIIRYKCSEIPNVFRIVLSWSLPDASSDILSKESAEYSPCAYPVMLWLSVRSRESIPPKRGTIFQELLENHQFVRNALYYHKYLLSLPVLLAEFLSAGRSMGMFWFWQHQTLGGKHVGLCRPAR